MSDIDLPDDDEEAPEARFELDDDDASDDDEAPGPEEQQAEALAPLRKRRKRRSPPKSPAHEARIAEYRGLVESRGWIFAPPSPERPISYLFDDLTVKQIVTLGTPDRQRRKRA